MRGILCSLFLSVSFMAASQSCTVWAAGLKGAYEGECKKNKADGNGTATGEDSYTGEFKNGYPEGTGKYTWKNGDWYEGAWKKGLREGQGTMHYANPTAKDTALTGFWKKDKYAGKYEKPYLVHSKTPDVTRSDVIFNNENSLNEITFLIESIRGGLGGINTKIQITDIVLMNGQYLNKVDNNNLPKTFISSLKGVQFPFRARINMGSDMIDMEFFEKGSYTVEIKILK